MPAAKRHRSATLKIIKYAHGSYEYQFRKEIRYADESFRLDWSSIGLGMTTITCGRKTDDRSVFVTCRAHDFGDFMVKKPLSYVELMTYFTKENQVELATFLFDVVSGHSIDLIPEWLLGADAALKQALSLFLSIVMFAERKRSRGANCIMLQYLEKVIYQHVEATYDTLCEYFPFAKSAKEGQLYVEEIIQEDPLGLLTSNIAISPATQKKKVLQAVSTNKKSNVARYLKLGALLPKENGGENTEAFSDMGFQFPSTLFSNKTSERTNEVKSKVSKRFSF